MLLNNESLLNTGTHFLPTIKSSARILLMEEESSMNFMKWDYRKHDLWQTVVAKKIYACMD